MYPEIDRALLKNQNLPTIAWLDTSWILATFDHYAGLIQRHYLNAPCEGHILVVHRAEAEIEEQHIIDMGGGIDAVGSDLSDLLYTWGAGYGEQILNGHLQAPAQFDAIGLFGRASLVAGERGLQFRAHGQGDYLLFVFMVIDGRALWHAWPRSEGAQGGKPQPVELAGALDYRPLQAFCAGYGFRLFGGNDNVVH